jgi:hypothetical protein
MRDLGKSRDDRDLHTSIIIAEQISMRFKPGISGNPGGRPKGHGEIRELARAHTMTALQALVEIAERGENESARVAAANAILDRGWGKAAVPVADSGAPPVITLNFGTIPRPPQRVGDDATPAIESGAPRLLPLLGDE